MLWEQMIIFLKSWFVYQGLPWDLMLVSIGLAIGFGAIWLLGYWPPVFKKVWFWPVMVVSAFLTLLAVTFVQIPLQYYINQGLSKAWDSTTIANWYLLMGIPAMLVSGLVQEASKLAPMAIWWWRSGKTITPKMGLIIGAVAGAGFGIFEAFWIHGSIFSAGWTTQAISQYGFDGIIGFWERFFTVGFHTGVSALVGYGLAKGKWWQYYLIAAGLHTLLNYSSVFLAYFTYVHPADWLKIAYIEIYLAVIAVTVMAAAMVLRWRKDNGDLLAAPIEPVASVEPAEPVKPAEPSV